MCVQSPLPALIGLISVISSQESAQNKQDRPEVVLVHEEQPKIEAHGSYPRGELVGRE